MIVLGGGYGLYQAGVVTIAPEQDQQLATGLAIAENKIKDLEKQLEAATQNTATRDAAGAIKSLEKRVEDLEGKVSTAASATSKDFTAEIAALQEQIKAVGAGSGTGSEPAGVPVDLAPLESRIASLESSSSAFSGNTGELSKKIDGLSGQVGDLSSGLSGLSGNLTELDTRLKNAEATAKAAQTAVSTSDVSLKTLADSQARATDTLASLSADITALGETDKSGIAAVRTDLETLSGRLAAVEATMGDATAREIAARALSVSALKSAVDSGRPFKTELAAVKAGLPAGLDVKALEDHAATGIEPVSVLIAQFPEVARKIYGSFSEADPSGDVLESLLNSAKAIVAVRGPGGGDGTEPDAVLRRMEAAVAGGNLGAALEAYGGLPETARKAGADWAARAGARVEIDALTDRASQEVLNALAAKGS